MSMKYSKLLPSFKSRKCLRMTSEYPCKTLSFILKVKLYKVTRR